MSRIDLRDLTIALASMVAGIAFVVASSGQTRSQVEVDLPSLRPQFARPTSLPTPADNPLTPAKIALGERLFADPILSANSRISCATCHDAKLGLGDGAPLSRAGATGKELGRHTPAIWNLAWAPALFWDGRAEGLEDQARFPMSHPDEMASTPEAAAQRLAGDPSYVKAFQNAFGTDARPSPDLLLKALAAYERTLISPPTRFDRWVAGDETALTAEQRRGFAIFAGKGRCLNCHVGFAFTEHAFHDIGLPGADLGRGKVVGIPAVERAFKTPTLRELAWTAPYMHDGSMATLEDVIRHYEGGGVMRPSRSRDMPPPFQLTDGERADLVSFLESLSSDDPPKPSTEPWVMRSVPPAAGSAAAGTTVSQRNRQFAPGAIKVARGETLTITNDDTRTHNVSIVSRLLRFNSGAQEPGESVALKLDAAGRFEAHCAIHPTMHLTIEVE